MKIKSLPRLDLAAADDKSRPMLYSVYWTGGELWATDGFIAARVTPDDDLGNEPCIIHLDAWNAAQDGADLEIIGKNTVKVKSEGLVVTYNGADYYGRYLDLDSFIPQGVKATWRVDTRELAEAGTVVKLVADGPPYIAKDYKPGSLKVATVDSLEHLPGSNQSARIELDTGRLYDLARAIMQPVVINRRHTYPVTILIDGEPTHPAKVIPAVEQEDFTSWGLIMPLSPSRRGV